MQKILIPAAAIAGVILLVGLIVATGGSPDPGSGKVAPEPKAPGGAKTLGTVPMDASGMSDAVPPLSAAEWKDIGGGLKIWDVKDGSDEGTVESTDQVSMHYIGWRATDGGVFDASTRRNEPLTASMTGGLIKGWLQGVPGMKIGGIRRLFIPSVLGYAGQPKDGIPPNTDLVFEVKLLRIIRK